VSQTKKVFIYYNNCNFFVVDFSRENNKIKTLYEQLNTLKKINFFGGSNEK